MQRSGISPGAAGCCRVLLSVLLPVLLPGVAAGVAADVVHSFKKVRRDLHHTSL
jgi:ABC-type spermidine/putrescine transport system permease subunit II